MPRATTAACEVLPPRLVRMPCDAKKPWMSSGLVSSRTSTTFAPVLPRVSRAIGVEDGLAARRAGRGGETRRERLALVRRIEAREQHLLEVRGIDARDRFLAREQALFVHLDRGAHHRRGVHLAVAGLQAIQRAALDRELEVLHFAVMLLEPVAQLDELRVHGRASPSTMSAMRLRRADAGDDVLALGVGQVLAVELVLARAGLRVKPTPVALSLPMLPNTMVTTLTAVPLAIAGVILNSRR